MFLQPSYLHIIQYKRNLLENFILLFSCFDFPAKLVLLRKTFENSRDKW